MEGFRHLKNELEHLWLPTLKPTLAKSFYKRLETCEASGRAFGAWYVNSYHDPHVTDVTPLERHQKEPNINDGG